MRSYPAPEARKACIRPAKSVAFARRAESSAREASRAFGISWREVYPALLTLPQRDGRGQRQVERRVRERENGENPRSSNILEYECQQREPHAGAHIHGRRQRSAAARVDVPRRYERRDRADEDQTDRY